MTESRPLGDAIKGEGRGQTADQRRDRLIDEPRPLSEWLRGTLRVQFVGGATLERETSSAQALALLRQVDGQQGADSIGWTTEGWFRLQAKVASVEFDLLPDGSLPLSRDERERIRANGFLSGVVPALIAHWEGRREPAYSGQAIHSILEVASGDAPDQFETFAELVEGPDGAALLARTRSVGRIFDPGVRADETDGSGDSGHARGTEEDGLRTEGDTDG